MYERLDRCPSCNSDSIINHLITHDYMLTQESFAIQKCNNCNLLFTNPRPTTEKIGSYYKSDDYISHSNKAINPIQWIYKIVRNITIRQKYKLIKKYSSFESLLDYGCGTAHFIDYVNQKGIKVVGIEPDEDARKIATSNNKEILENIKQLSPKSKFDVITLFHVLEHVHQPKELLQTLKTHLTKNGILIIAVPNPNSYDAKIYQEFWAAWDVPRHLFHFTKKSFEYLIKESGYKLKDIQPMKFDAFYVSLLSEKYKNNKNRYYKAFQRGLNSNKKAKSNNNYSSLIYIITK